jgi:hypothetical protein
VSLIADRWHRSRQPDSARCFGKMSFRVSASRVASDTRRGEFFAALFVFGCLNGFTPHIVKAVEENGWANALLGTFGISVIALLSCTAGVALVLRDRKVGVRPFEIAIGLGFLLFATLPIYATSWIAITALSLYVFFSSDAVSSRRGATILLATTVPMLWSRLLFKFFSHSILAVDASLVSWLLGTHRSGTLVEFADGSAQLAIFPGCSSLANVSLAFLFWITLSELVSHKKSAYDYLWCFLACLAVVAVNVSRMAMLGLSEGNYLSFHNEWADAVVNVIILVLIFGISALGVRRELFQHV